jgi:hypothetical protein
VKPLSTLSTSEEETTAVEDFGRDFGSIHLKRHGTFESSVDELRLQFSPIKLLTSDRRTARHEEGSKGRYKKNRRQSNRQSTRPKKDSVRLKECEE